jgi:two-component system, response regulator PdtaR
MHDDVAIVPLQGFPSHWRHVALAPYDCAESGMQADQRDRILIVEDDLLVASEIEAALREAGFEIAGIASTGKEALQLTQAELPTLAVMDIRIAGDRDGIDTALELFHLHGIRSIFASAHSDADSRRRAESAAPLGWLQKPYTMASLTAMVRAAVHELRGQRD